jgi:hypothetical protein
VGYDATASDFNGIRVKSDESRGGLVNDISYSKICMRDMTNAILVSTAYNPQFAGTSYPDFRALTFQNIRHVSCMGLQRPVVTLEGFNAALPLGPVTLSNVIIDNMGSLDVAAEFANITLGPGDVNFTARGSRGRGHRHPRREHAPAVRLSRPCPRRNCRRDGFGEAMVVARNHWMTFRASPPVRWVGRVHEQSVRCQRRVHGRPGSGQLRWGHGFGRDARANRPFLHRHSPAGPRPNLHRWSSARPGVRRPRAD